MTIAVPVDLADAALTAEMAEDLAVVEAALRDTTFGVVVTIVLGVFPQPIVDLATKASSLVAG